MCECLDHDDPRYGRSAHVCEACFPSTCPDGMSLGDWCLRAERTIGVYERYLTQVGLLTAAQAALEKAPTE